MANALFVCLHNAGRSQISEALFELAAEGRHRARSAGTTPGARVHPEVVEAMNELGIDLSDRVPHELSEDDARWADVVVTMGCGDECPYVPGRRYLDWDLPDPKGRPLEEVRATRDEIERRVAGLIAELDREAPGPAAPIACSLGAAEMADRLATVAAIGQRSLVAVEGSAAAPRLRFRADPETRAELERFVAAEQRCCAFLDLSLRESGGQLELKIGSPAAGAPVVEELVAAFAGDRPS